jgi:2-oxoglutarate ferredoxin oxidoreductase subunit delta
VTPKARLSYRISLNHSYCTGCGNCIQYCPPHVLERDAKLNKRGIFTPVVVAIEQCTGCKLCELYCGNFAVSVSVKPGAVEEGVV